MAPVYLPRQPRRTTAEAFALAFGLVGLLAVLAARVAVLAVVLGGGLLLALAIRDAVLVWL